MTENARGENNGTATMSLELRQLWETPPMRWRDAAPPNYSAALELSRELDGLMLRAARLRAYLDVMAANGRSDDATHAAAVKAGNRLVAKLRKALGFTVTRDDVSF